MKIHPYAWLCALMIALLLSTSCASRPASTLASSAATDNSQSQGLLWKIEKTRLEPSYIFGTIHVEDERVTRLPQIVEQHFATATTFALEVELNPQAQQTAVAAMFYADGRTLLSVAGEDLFRQSVQALGSRGMQQDQILLMKPWAVFSLLSMPESESGLFLDAMLYRQAIARGQRIRGLETMAEQIAVFDTLSEGDQLALLRDTLANQDDIDRFIEQTIQVYLSRDLQQLIELNEQYMKFTDEDLARRVNERLVDERNRRMLIRIAPLLQQGGTFIAVGALHLPGEQGLLQLLRREGYQLTAIH